MKNKKTILKITILTIILIYSVHLIRNYNENDINLSSNNYIFSSLLKEIDIMSLHVHNNILYAGTPDGLFKVSGSYPDYYMEKVNLDYDLNYIRALYTDNNNNFWIGSENGLLCILPNNNQIIYSEENGLIPDNRINTITQLSDGTIWIGSWSGATQIKENNNIRTINKETGLINNMVNVITEDIYGGIWFGSYNVKNGGITYLKDNEFNYFTTENGLINNNITSYLFIDKDTLWFGSGIYESGGITTFDLSNKTPYIKETLDISDGFAGIKVRSLYKYNKSIFIGSEYDGIAIWNDSKKIYTTDDGLANNEVKSYELYNNLLFFGTRNGLSYKKAKK